MPDIKIGQLIVNNLLAKLPLDDIEKTPSSVTEHVVHIDVDRGSFCRHALKRSNADQYPIFFIAVRLSTCAPVLRRAYGSDRDDIESFSTVLRQTAISPS